MAGICIGGVEDLLEGKQGPGIPCLMSHPYRRSSPAYGSPGPHLSSPSPGGGPGCRTAWN